MKAVFLDRDGTLNLDHEGYTHRLEDFALYPDVIPSLKRLSDYALFIITNQSGVGRGHYTERQMHAFNTHLVKTLEQEGIPIRKVYSCVHAPEEGCDCRKPGQRFAEQARKEFGIDLRHSWVIGDHDTDILFGKGAGMRSVLLLTGHGVKHLERGRAARPDYIAATLSQATDFVLIDEKKGKGKIVPREEIGKVAEEERKRKRSIVTLNGTFDILHPGHERIIKEAKKQGDILIVAVNADASVRRNKGKDRPLNTESSRAGMLAAFREVDYVTIFPEATPIALLEEIRPDVHVNGSEYGKDCIEAPTVRKHGGKLYIVELVQGHSTTKLLEGG